MTCVKVGKYCPQLIEKHKKDCLHCIWYNPPQKKKPFPMSDKQIPMKGF